MLIAEELENQVLAEKDRKYRRKLGALIRLKKSDFEAVKSRFESGIRFKFVFFEVNL